MDNFFSEQKTEWLELLFDLVFVITFSTILNFFHHLNNQELISYLLEYVLLITSVWWLWMMHTLYTNYYDDDKKQYILITVILMLIMLLINTIEIQNFFKATNLFISYYMVYIVVMIVVYYVKEKKETKKDQIISLQQSRTISIISLIPAILAIIITGYGSIILFLLSVLINVLSPLYHIQNQITAVKMKHFYERHGLLMIIIIGENLVAIVESTKITFQVTLVVILFMIVISFALQYFENLEQAIQQKTDVVHVNKWLRYADVSGYAMMYGHLILILGLGLLSLEFFAIMNQLEISFILAIISTLLIGLATTMIFALTNPFIVKLKFYLLLKSSLLLTVTLVSGLIILITNSLILILILQFSFMLINNFVDKTKYIQ